MRIFATKAFWIVLITLEVATGLCGQQRPVEDIQKCRRFVQGFYDWYVPKALKETEVPASDLALKARSTSFSADLFRALREDSEAQAKAPGEIVGLDFDPFLNTQDPGTRYVVGKVTPRADSYLVDVYRMDGSKRGAKPAVVAQVSVKGGQCIFVNFHYGKSQSYEGKDLLTVLKALKTNREKYAK